MPGKKPMVEEEFDNLASDDEIENELAEMKAVKLALDPTAMLNPGDILDVEGAAR